MAIRRTIFILLLAAWMALWGWFIARELFLKGGFTEYRDLLRLPLDGRRSYVTGDRFYEFLAFCNSKLPAQAAYLLVGPEENSIEKWRAAYYLYPHLEKKDAPFILVYGKADTAPLGAVIIAELDGSRCIMERRPR